MDSGFKGLNVYKDSYKMAMKIFNLSKSFPASELYGLTSQIRRSSRAVSANIAEGYRKRLYPRHFASTMTNADAECSETLVWLDFALDCGYMDPDTHKNIVLVYQEIGRKLGSMIENPEKFIPKNKMSLEDYSKTTMKSK